MKNLLVFSWMIYILAAVTGQEFEQGRSYLLTGRFLPITTKKTVAPTYIHVYKFS